MMETTIVLKPQDEWPRLIAGYFEIGTPRLQAILRRFWPDHKIDPGI